MIKIYGVSKAFDLVSEEDFEEYKKRGKIVQCYVCKHWIWKGDASDTRDKDNVEVPICYPCDKRR